MGLSIRAALCSALLLAFAIVPNAALAAKPDHGSFTGSLVDPDFCGTGAAIDISFAVVFNTQSIAPGIWKTTQLQKVEFTNPANAMKVIQSISGNELVTETDLADGTFIFEHTFRGNFSTLKTYQGPVLVKDAGYIVIDVHLDDQGNLISQDVLVAHGPHPSADSDFTLFCGVMETALGI